MLVLLGFKELLELGLKKVLHCLAVIRLIDEAKLAWLVLVMSLRLVVTLILSGQCAFKQVRPVSRHRLLELQHDLGVYYGDALWAATIDDLLCVLLIVDVVDTLSSLGIVEHGLQMNALVHICLGGCGASIAWE